MFVNVPEVTVQQAGLQTIDIGHVAIGPITPAHIPLLEIHDVSANATVGQVELHNVVAPYELLNLTLSQIGIDTLQVPSVAIA